MIDATSILERSIQQWRTNYGRGIIVTKGYYDKTAIAVSIIERMLVRSPTLRVHIVATNAAGVVHAKRLLTNIKGDIEINTIVDGKCYDFVCLIGYNIANLSIDSINSKYYLIIVNTISKVPPGLKTPIIHVFSSDNEYNSIRLQTPVEEHRVRVPISIADREEYDKYSDYINTTIGMFGTYDNIRNAINGDAEHNISSIAVCQKVAADNGWTSDLDLSIEYNRKINEIYNPEALLDRAIAVDDIIRKRKQLVCCNENKINVIVDIVNELANKKILIINHSAEFARKVTSGINEKSKAKCMDYHTKLEKVPAEDLYGNLIFVKTGKSKGDVKYMGDKAQRTLANQRYNANIINVISTNNAPDKDFEGEVDVIIISSPLCINFRNLILRLNGLILKVDGLVLYRFFVANTLEERALTEFSVSPNVTKIINTDANNVNNCENSDNFNIAIA